MHGPVSLDLTEMWEARQNELGKHRNTQPTPLYEKVLFFFFFLPDIVFTLISVDCYTIPDVPIAAEEIPY
jgi:hypothetical protein